jgi:hypothetical protein
MLTVPIPLQVDETKIQPSRERVNVYDFVGCEIEETSSNSETRLFNFFSPEKGIAPFVGAAAAQIRIATKAVGAVVIENSIVIQRGSLAIHKLAGALRKTRQAGANQTHPAFAVTHSPVAFNSKLPSTLGSF